MSGAVDGIQIERSEIEHGVRFPDGEIYQADDEKDANFIATWSGGTIIIRRWYATPWSDAE